MLRPVVLDPNTLAFTIVLLLLVPLATVYAQDVESGPFSPVLVEPESNLETSDEQQRELGGNEDPLTEDQVERNVERDTEDETALRPWTSTREFDVYGSLRLRFRDRTDTSEWEDGGSRLGGDAEWQFREGSFLIGRYEAGFNVLAGKEEEFENIGKLAAEIQDSTFTRLAYVGIDSPYLTLIAGKNWSTYYKIADFTDRFNGTGGSASGTYNAQTDGGPTGTGRADRVLQTKFSAGTLPLSGFKPFTVNLQFQQGNRIPFSDGIDYDSAAGISTVLTTEDDLAIGFAYNHAEVDLKESPSLRSIGIVGDARAALLGMRAFGDRWYVGVVVSRLENHETTDEGIYFKGWGSEFYGQFRLTDRLWFIGGFNALEPDSNQLQAGDYRVRYTVAGIRYTYDDFRRMIYANVRLDDSVDADGRPGANVYTIGIRWDLSKRRWKN